MAKKKKGSPNPGLTPPALQEEIRKELDNVKKMPKVRNRRVGKSRPVLPNARKKAVGGDGGGGVFGAADVHDGEREASGREGKVPVKASPPKSVDAAVSDILRDMVHEQMPEGCTYLHGMLKQVVIKAAMGEQWAIDFVANRLEGKPGQQAKKTTSLEDVEDAITQAEMATIEQFMETEDGTTGNEGDDPATDGARTSTA